MFPEDAEAIEIVTKKVQEHLPALERLGLIFERTFVIPSEIVNPSYWYVFQDRLSSYVVSISFSVVKGHKGGLFGTYIRSTDQKHMAIKDYLHFHGFFVQERLFQCSYEVPDFERYVDVFLTSQEELFAGKLKPFIEGKAWEDVPIDWGPYK